MRPISKVIDTGYRPREAFVPFHKRDKRWSVIVAHRRAGKTVACVTDMIDAAVRCEREEGRFAYIAPFYNQAKDIAWTYLKKYTEPLWTALPNESELRVDIRAPKANSVSRIRLYGADNPHRLRGLYLDGVVLDEYGDMSPSVWGEIVRPMLADRQGWATFIGTPKGKNHFWEMWDKSRNDADWFHMMLRASETGLVPSAELIDAKRTMSPDEYEQEFECSFEAAIKGAYYADQFRDIDAQNRIKPLRYDPSLGVTTAWDLGYGDSTAIWFAQQVAGEIRLIDYYESAGVGLDHYVQTLQEKKYVYKRHFMPHDAEQGHLGTGKSLTEQARGMGVANIQVVPKLSVDAGIQAARLLLPTCVFDPKCGRGLTALREYRKDYDEDLKIWKPRPRHDWASHGADAFRYLSVGLRPEAAAKHRPAYNFERDKPRGSWMTA